MENFARFGYVSKGFVYGLIGILALLAAFNQGGKTTDPTGALHEIATQPFGQIVLILIAIGLFGYVIWRLVEAIKDPDHHGSDAKGLATRLGYLISGLVYSGIAANAALLAIGSSSGGGSGNSQQDWTAIVMQQPFGRWLVGLAGAIIVGLGFALIYQAYKEKFRKKLNMSELNGQQKNWLVKISRFGIAARGVVFIIIGFFVLQAAYKSNPNEVRGLDGALLSLSQQPFGKFLLALVAAGLVAYGIYLFVQARYRRFKFSG
ncbi:protein of unknown function DUF1206 [Stanieria cyanosphaera PCC 7437]|uniref:DUF1206 domain-containing protein n=1 Tax=Stanieria cyanosphaera (strain ATCC 29371 / PCC 7437) TaxID=111780 RepID=K9XMG6_STAC7|nr:DUF1206 domain-containing protein [Stanieria cyanosphaera]AFZ33795.1 protein of unknown function DUF1206 [Stanieria cyanosphaera PCC 7437]